MNEDLKKILILLHSLNPCEELEEKYFNEEFQQNTEELLHYLKQSQNTQGEKRSLALIHARSRALNLEQLYSEILDAIESEIKK